MELFAGKRYGVIYEWEGELVPLLTDEPVGEMISNPDGDVFVVGACELQDRLAVGSRNLKFFY